MMITMRRRRAERSSDRLLEDARMLKSSDLPSSTADRPGAAYRLRGLEFAKYFIVSLIALLVDAGLLLVLARQMHYALAATIGFVTGAFVHYLLSVAFVFRRRKLEHRRWLESSLFVLFGVVALGVNVAVIAFCVELFATPLLVAKIIAAGFSFLVGYFLRKLALF